MILFILLALITNSSDPCTNAACGQRITATMKDTTTPVHKYGLKTVASVTEYEAQVKDDPRQRLVALNDFIPGIQLDIRYATSRNIVGRPVYSKAAAYLRLPAAEALKGIQEELAVSGLGLKIFDGYRPYAVTVTFYEELHDTVFVASPYSGSKHNRGCSVDLSLVDLRTGKELRMPTGYDSFSKQAHSDFAGADAEAIKNRELLKSVMTRHGFLIYPDEWWHFDFAGWRAFPVMDIPFEELPR